MSADVISAESQNKSIAELKEELAFLRRDTIELSERRRGWIRAGIVCWFCLLLSYVVVKHTGVGDGQIKPEIIWSFGTGVFVTKLIDYYINTSNRKDRVL